MYIIFTPRINDHLNVKNGLFFVFSAYDSKKLVTAKYLSTSERSYFAFSENATNYWVLSYHY